MKRAEVAGAGFAGLGAAIALARSGWQVRIHERAHEVREVGAGIFMTHNGLTVLEEYGAMDLLRPLGVEIQSAKMIDAGGRELQDRRPAPSARRMWTFPRQDLLQALHRIAVREGVNVVTGSEVVGAHPSGRVDFRDGSSVDADLVVGADGHLSAVRNSLGLTKRQGPLPTVSVRYLILGRDLEPEPATKQYWSGRRRMAVTACAPDKTYVYLSCPEGDVAEAQGPGWTESWRRSFPMLHQVFDVLERHDPYVARYSLAQTLGWTQGRVALLGDAAHALPPTLGQGANLALTNGRSLATFLEAFDDVPEALAVWESALRPLAERTQRWSLLYDRATTRWPEVLSPLRNGIVWLFGTLQPLNRRMRVAERTPAITQIEHAKSLGGMK